MTKIRYTKYNEIDLYPIMLIPPTMGLFGVLQMVQLEILPMVPLVAIGRANGTISITTGTNGITNGTIGIPLVPMVEP